MTYRVYSKWYPTLGRVIWLKLVLSSIVSMARLCHVSETAEWLDWAMDGEGKQEESGEGR